MVLRRAQRLAAPKAERMLAAIRPRETTTQFEQLLSTYEAWSKKEKGRYDTPAATTKATALSKAIMRVTEPQHLAALREALRRLELKPSTRWLVLALLESGSRKDIRIVLDRIATCGHEVEFWNHTELGRAAARRLELEGRGLPKFLREIADVREFWEYMTRDERRDARPRDRLPVARVSNRGLYIRLAGYAMIGLATSGDTELLAKLAGHYFRLMARAAAVRLVRLVGEEGLRILAAETERDFEHRNLNSLADALRYAEFELHGVITLW